jgi:hypothetical protein
MSNNKQSSVEWYSVKRDVLEMRVRLGKISGNEYAEELAKAEQHAKEIHRTEIIESYASGSNDRLKNTINTNYYAETFGGNNEQQ